MLKTMDFILKMMDIVLKMTCLLAQPVRTDVARRLLLHTLRLRLPECPRRRRARRGRGDSAPGKEMMNFAFQKW